MESTLKKLATQAIKDQEYLHQYPELSWEEFETSKYIQKRLTEMNIEILDFPINSPSVIGYIKGTVGNQTIALRADMDALPIQEDEFKSIVSKNDGVSHACGHDGHMSILLAVSDWLSNHQDEIKPNIMLIFQSSEEITPSGGKHLINHGVIEDVDAIFGLHLWPETEKGKMGLCPGPMMASSDDFDIYIEGKGGHGSNPHTTVDPIFVATQVVQGIQSVVTKNTSPFDPAVVSICSLTSGTTYNVFPNNAQIKGTIRGFSVDSAEKMRQEVQNIAEFIPKVYHAKGTFEFIKGTPPLINDELQSQYVRNVIEKSFPEGTFEEINPVMGSEDFSHYLLQKPGAFVFVGIKGDISTYPLHHAKFQVDTDVFQDAIKLFIEIVKNYHE